MGPQRGSRAGAGTRGAGWCEMMDEGQPEEPVPTSKNAKRKGSLACGTHTKERGHCWAVHIGQKATGDSWETEAEPKLLANSRLFTTACLGDWARGCWMSREWSTVHWPGPAGSRSLTGLGCHFLMTESSLPGREGCWLLRMATVSEQK